tara:strand:+ start:961 stop:1656 length:696 start_codon:yes stop_codon:yes gene_type:complete
MRQSLNHVSIIMDGNNRWAKSKGISSREGHKEGVKKARLAVEFALENKIDYLTLFAFSTENWLRDTAEVNDLVSLFFDALEEQTPKLIEEKVKLNFIGDISRFNRRLIERIKKSSKETENSNPELNLIIAASYGGKWDIINSINKTISSNKLKEISENDLEKNLETKEFPDPDLIIRSGGEKRLSNFYLWQSSYSELYFSDKFWPDFEKDDLQMACEDYFKRKRKFGAKSG